MCSEADLIVVLSQLRCTVRQRAELLHLHQVLISFESRIGVKGTGAYLWAHMIMPQ